jgi:hypothetical protein
MRSPNAFDETKSPFLLEALETLGTEAQEAGPQDERLAAADHECECGGRCHETASEEAFEGEDAFEMEEEDEAGSPDAFERYQASDGEAAWETETTDQSEDSGSEWETVAMATDEAPPQDFAEAYEADAMLAAEDEAPDLAYDVQENEDEAPFLDETEAPEFEGQVPAQAQVVVSNGEFGNALALFARNAGLPNAVPWLLTQSAAFNAIVQTLDGKYVHLDGPTVPVSWGIDWAPDADGVLTKGPHAGQRMVLVRVSVGGTFFTPWASPDFTHSADTIVIETPSLGAAPLDQRGLWLERIVHESIHAHRHVTGLRRSGATPAQRISAAIDDEIATRQQEGAIVNDLRTRFPNFGRYQPTTGSLVPAEVERDFFSGALRLSYLEHFVLGERLDAARRKLEAAFVPNKRSRTATDEISAYNAFVDRIPLEKRPLASYLVPDPIFTRPDRDQPARFLLDYPRIRLIRRVIDARWRSVPGIDRRNAHRDPDVEKMRQEHARLFFAGLASYTRLP